MLTISAIQRLQKRCQRALLTLGAVGLLAFPALAQDGILRASDPQSQINLRSSPDPNSRRLGYGLVGDRVEIIEQVPGSDDYTWYRVRFYQSGAVGWIRGDFIEVVAGSGQTGSSQIRYQEGYDRGYQMGYRDGQNARRYNAGFHPDQFIQAGSGSRDPEYDRGFRAGFFAGFDLGYNTPITTTPTPSDGTLLAFQTVVNAVRIYNRAGQTYMNIFDKQQGRTWLNGVAVAVEQNRTGTSYRYQGETTVVVFQGTDGSRTLDINGQIEEGY